MYWPWLGDTILMILNFKNSLILTFNISEVVEDMVLGQKKVWTGREVN